MKDLISNNQITNLANIFKILLMEVTPPSKNYSTVSLITFAIACCSQLVVKHACLLHVLLVALPKNIFFFQIWLRLV